MLKIKDEVDYEQDFYDDINEIIRIFRANSRESE